MPTFASPDAPLRASSLPRLMQCPHSHMVQQLQLVEKTVTRNMDSGSAVHSAIDAWNKGADVDKALESMRSRLTEFPLADLHDAELSFRPYAADPRNKASAVAASEVKVRLLLPCWAQDSTGEDICIVGTADQVRVDGLWDVKHSEKRPVELYHDYSFQLACYAAGLRIPIGGIINPRGYRRRGAEPAESGETKGVFLYPCWQQAHIDRLLNEIRVEVARIRAGYIAIRPGSQCEFCPAGGFYRCEGLSV